MTTPHQAISLLLEISAERSHQDEKWGGATHDDQHSTNEFLTFIGSYSSKACDAAAQGDAIEARRRLIQVAALAIASVESIDRKQSSPKSSSNDGNQSTLQITGPTIDDIRNDYRKLDSTCKALIIALAPSLSVDQLRLVGSHTGAWFVFVDSPPYYLIRAED
jgi:hypothetical protein